VLVAAVILLVWGTKTALDLFQDMM